MSFVIACDKRDDPSTTLFMVDRRRQRQSFWSDRLDDALVYRRRVDAQLKVARLRYNSPRVLPLEEAREIADAQAMWGSLDEGTSTEGVAAKRGSRQPWEDGYG